MTSSHLGTCSPLGSWPCKTRAWSWRQFGPATQRSGDCRGRPAVNHAPHNWLLPGFHCEAHWGMEGVSGEVRLWPVLSWGRKKWGRREGSAEVDHSYLHYCQDETFPHLPRLQALYLGNKRKSMPGWRALVYPSVKWEYGISIPVSEGCYEN